MHRVAGVVTADFLLDLGRAGHLAAADLNDLVAALELGLGGRRVRAAGGDHGVARIEVLRLHEDPRHAGVEVLALAELGKDLLNGLQRHSEADARVVPFDAGDFLGRLRRERHDQAHHAAADIDQRTAVVVGRSGGVGLQGLAPHPAHGARECPRPCWAASPRTCGPRPRTTAPRASPPAGPPPAPAADGRGRSSAARVGSCDRGPPAWQASACRREAARGSRPGGSRS